MSINEEGRVGEEKARQTLIKWKYPHQQIDWLVGPIGEKKIYFFVEVKYQEMFKAPPFDGHGLPVKQVEKRMGVYNNLGLATLFMVFEKGTNIMYRAWLHELEKTDYFDTSIKGRRIYNIKSFEK